MSDVRAYAGVPTVTQFAGPGTPSAAAPLVVDSTTGFIYSWKTGDIITLAGGGAGTVTHSAGALTANALVVGNALADVDILSSLGTLTTVLHGNAAGRPTFGAVALGTDVSGTLAAAQFPALTGDITTSVGSLATALGTNVVTNAKAAQMATNTVKGNNTGGTANALDLTIAQVQTLLAIPAQTIGSWTPADNSGAALVFSSVSAGYTKIGNMVFAYGTWIYPVTIDGTAASISGLPATVANVAYAQMPAIAATTVTITGGLVMLPIKNTTTAKFDVGSPFGIVTNAQLSGATVSILMFYPTT